MENNTQNWQTQYHIVGKGKDLIHCLMDQLAKSQLCYIASFWHHLKHQHLWRAWKMFITMNPNRTAVPVCFRTLSTLRMNVARFPWILSKLAGWALWWHLRALPESSVRTSMEGRSSLRLRNTNRSKSVAPHTWWIRLLCTSILHRTRMCSNRHSTTPTTQVWNTVLIPEILNPPNMNKTSLIVKDHSSAQIKVLHPF